MQDPLVTAIIITHDRLAFLKKALRSIQNQTYTNIEITVVDNGSNTDTRLFLETCKSIKLITTYEFMNANFARNLGVHASNGKYIAFLDDDDEWLETKIERQVQFMEKFEEYGLCYTGMRKIYDSNLAIDYKAKYYNSGDMSTKIFEGIFTNTSTLMIRRNIFFDNNIFFDEELSHWQEYDLLVQMSLVTKFGELDDALTIINVSSSSKDRLSNQFYKWENAVQYFYSKHNQRISQLDSYTNKKLKLNYINDAIVRLDNKKKVYWKRSYYILKRIMITKSPRSCIYLVPGISLNTIRKFSK